MQDNIDIICANFMLSGDVYMLREGINHSGYSEEDSELDGESPDSGTKLLESYLPPR